MSLLALPQKTPHHNSSRVSPPHLQPLGKQCAGLLLTCVRQVSLLSPPRWESRHLLLQAELHGRRHQYRCGGQEVHAGRLFLMHSHTMEDQLLVHVGHLGSGLRRARELLEQA
ncbi:hypothetical protein E2C01_048916 [Portunus trituberculatus]|uniref:Uncharacterized protein n=1 Tax=Portunus trituberculatus TaxID=210409 RepID=A0A5B7GCA6_PORTR|nr:hypothetical protein [Portunus trituberculatus]